MKCELRWKGRDCNNEAIQRVSCPPAIVTKKAVCRQCGDLLHSYYSETTFHLFEEPKPPEPKVTRTYTAALFDNGKLVVTPDDPMQSYPSITETFGLTNGPGAVRAYWDRENNTVVFEHV